MKRREFVGGVAGAAVLPLIARAQQPERMRRIGVLMSLTESDLESIARLAVFRTALSELGWIDGGNIRIEIRWGADIDHIRRNAGELAALPLDVIVVNANPSMVALQQVRPTVPIVFVGVTDPVSMGIVQSLARPGGNATGFTAAEFSMSAKWLELLKEVAPGLKRVAVLREPSNPSALPQFASIQTAAPSFGVEVSSIGLREVGEIERGIGAFARSANGGLIVTRIAEAIHHRDLIIKLAAQHRLPAIYPLRFFATAGGLIAYGTDIVDQYRRAAGYVDRILNGEKAADMPVQSPGKYDLVINLKTAKALGLAVPEALLAQADEVIE